MREKGRDSRERDPVRNQEWKTVKHRRKPPNKSPQASRTCFINHLPLHITSHEIASIFKTHGPIEFIYIPVIRQPRNHKCAFVQFQYPQSLPSAIRDEHKRRVEPNRITVHPAKYDKPTFRISNPANHNLPPPPKRTEKKHTKTNLNRNAMRDSRSYKEAISHPKTTDNSPQMNHPNTSVDPCKPILHPFPFESSNQIANNHITSKPNPSYNRIMNSRVLGEDTEKVRNSLGEIDLDGDLVAAIEGEVCAENQEMLERSVIGIASSSLSSEIILDHIISEGVLCLTIKAMGGMLHLITFDTFEEKKEMVESGWLDRWFMCIRNVNDHSATLWRETWLKVYGVPLIAWSYDNFYKIGCVFGRVNSVNYKEYDCAHVLIFTDSLFELNGKLSMKIGDENYSIYVSETKIANYLPQQSREPLPQNPKTPVSPPLPDHPKSPFSENVPPSPSNVEVCHLINANVKSFTPHVDQDKRSNDDVPPQLNDKSVHQPSPQKSSNLASPNHCLALTSPLSSSKSKTKSLIPTPLRPNNKAHAQPYHKPNQVSSSPVKTYNKFGPLSRSQLKLNSSSTTNKSSSCTGPLFPPGFEDTIPNHFKLAQEAKRKRKIEKKKKLKLLSGSYNQDHPHPLDHSPFGSVSADDIIEMAGLIGLSFNGSMIELRSRIEAILIGQSRDWASLKQ